MSFEKVPNFLVNFFGAEMNGNVTPSYRFNSFLLDVAERQLSRDNKPLQLTPKAFDVLVYLVEHSGHLVLKDELMQAVWPDSFVDEVNLPRTVHTIRGTLGEDDNGNKFIETVPTKGYRFVANVEVINGNGADVRPSELVLDPIEKQDAVFGKSQPRTVLIFAVAAILVVSVAGFWFANKSGPAKPGFKGSTAQTNNGEAYQLYRLGRVLLEKGYGGDVRGSLAYFEKAIELDPNFAAAYTGKAEAKIWMFGGLMTSHDDIGQARTAINKALELDESSSYAHTVLCRLKATYEWEFKAAEQECRRAIDLDPNNDEAHREMAFLVNSLGHEDEAMREIDAAVALIPTSFNKRSRGAILYYSRRYDEAIEQFRQVEETDPNEYDTRRWLMNAYEMKKDDVNALETRIRQMEYDKATPDEIAAVRAVFDKSGWPGVLRGMIDPTKRPTFAWGAAYAQLGDKNRAFEVFEKILDRRAIMLVQAARDPRLDPLRNDPRFDDLLKRIGLK